MATTIFRLPRAAVNALKPPAVVHDVVVVGGGQAGLCAGYFLKKLGKSSMILEREKHIAPMWRNVWDSFTLVSPNLAFKVPGFVSHDPDTFLTAMEVVDALENLAGKIHLPVMTGTCVTRMYKEESDFILETSTGTFGSRAVIVATGPFHKPKLPEIAADISRDVLQLHTSQYKNPKQLPEGSVLVVGAGQSGAQIAKELLSAGRNVFLSVGERCLAAPRRYRGREVAHWFYEMGLMDMTIDKHPKGEAVRFMPNPALHSSGTVLVQQLGLQGANVVGKVMGVDADRVTLLLKDNVLSSLQMVLGSYNQFAGMVEAYVSKAGISAQPPEPLPESITNWVPPQVPEKLDLAEAGITSIIWATGYTRDYSWIDVPGFDSSCTYPEQQRGVTDVPGLYFLGLHWMHTAGSATFAGVAGDAEHVTQHANSFLSS